MQKKHWGKRVGETILAFTLVASVAALLFKENSGALLIFDREKEFVAPLYLWLFVALGATVGLLSLGLAFWASDQLKHRHEIHLAEVEDRQATPQQRTIKMYQEREYVHVSNLEFDITRAEGAVVESLQATLLALGESQASDGYRSRKGVIIYGDGHATDFEVGILLDSKAWLKGSVTKFVGDKSGTGTDAPDALKLVPMKSLAENAEYVVCFGLASNDEGDEAVKNDALSDLRALNLCRAIRNLDLVKRSDTNVVALGFGQPDNASAEGAASSLQRSAVVVAISDAWQDLSGRDIALAAAKLTTPQGVKLDKYSRSNGGYTVLENVQKGPYLRTENWNVSGSRSAGPIVHAKRKDQ